MQRLYSIHQFTNFLLGIISRPVFPLGKKMSLWVLAISASFAVSTRLAISCARTVNTVMIPARADATALKPPCSPRSIFARHVSSCLCYTLILSHYIYLSNTGIKGENRTSCSIPLQKKNKKKREGGGGVDCRTTVHHELLSIIREFSTK